MGNISFKANLVLSSSLKETKDYTKFDVKSQEDTLKRDFKKATSDYNYDLVAFSHKDGSGTDFQLRKNSKNVASGSFSFLDSKKEISSLNLVCILKSLVKKYEFEQAKSPIHTEYNEKITAQMKLLSSPEIDKESVMKAIDGLKHEMEQEMSQLRKKFDL